MKILGIYQNNPGSFHRIVLPLISLENVIIENELTEELIIKHKPDVIYIHWTSPVSIPELSIWQAKYRFKIIADIDDTWNLPSKYNRIVFQSQNLCLFADGVICTNSLIENQVKRFNNNTIIIRNALPKSNIIKQRPEIFTIGLYGSISHKKNWLSIKKEIKKIADDKDLKNKIRFVICGVDNNKDWLPIINMFPKNRLKLYNSTTPENAINCLDNIDILLCPLLDDDISQCRSNLKVFECAYKRCIPIIGKTYLRKDPLNELLPVEHYHENIKQIVTNEETWNYCQSMLHLINSTYNYEEECTQKRVEFIQNTKSEDKEIAEIYTITYRPEQFGEYRLFYNPVKTIKEKSYLFEYNPMIFLTDCSKTDKYFGIFSWKFPLKTGFYKKAVYRILEKEKSDVVIFCKQMKDYLKESEKSHPGLQNIIEKICNKIGLSFTKPTTTVYSNFFVAKLSIYKEYVEILKKAIEVMENDEEIKELVWKDASYYNGLNSQELKNSTELDYYTFHTFVLERLFSIWLENQNYTISIYY